MTDKERLINLFMTHPHEWISLPEIQEAGGAQYAARIFELRRGMGCPKMNIKNKTGTNLVAGVRVKNSWYRYLPTDKEKQMEFK